MAALAVMRHPELFKVAVAGAPVVDWRDYDTHYTERYMGLPDENKAGYEASSVLTWCKDLSVPLLIIHGTADDNVYFLHSLKMTEALFRAGKTFEFLPLAGFTHMVPEPNVTIRLNSRIAAFFKQRFRWGYRTLQAENSKTRRDELQFPVRSQARGAIITALRNVPKGRRVFPDFPNRIP